MFPGVVLPPVMSSTRYSPINPLFAAGLIPEYLSDILLTPLEDAALQKKKTKRITGAKYLTSDEYEEMLREEDIKKSEACNKRGRVRENKRRRREKRRKKKWKKKEGKGNPPKSTTSRNSSSSFSRRQ